jgi:hypothetical protein
VYGGLILGLGGKNPLLGCGKPRGGAIFREAVPLPSMESGQRHETSGHIKSVRRDH